jgi:hypothetical protein
MFERLDVRGDDWPNRIDSKLAGTIFQTQAWLSFISKTQHGELVVAALKEGRQTIGYFTGLIVEKFGLRILGSPFPGWSTDYMGLMLSSEMDRRHAVQALIGFAFHELRCVHLEMMDRNLTVNNLIGLGIQYEVYKGFEVDLTLDEDELFSNMTSACRRCIRKAEKEGVVIEEAHDLGFADEYYAQLRDVFARQGLTPTYDIERVRQLIALVQPSGHLLLLRARDRYGRCIATGIFPHMNEVMYFWGGASWRRHQLSRPNEAIQLGAMRIGKQRGLRTYDMGGGGEYKRKYGGSEIEVPWFRKSKYPWIRHLRDLAQQSQRLNQQFWGRFSRFRVREGPPRVWEKSAICR